MRPPVITRAIRPTRRERWTFAADLHERPPIDPRPALRTVDDVLWVLAGGAIVVLVAACVLLLLSGCAAESASVRAATTAHVELARRYEDEQRACLTLSTSDYADACVLAVRRRYAPAWAAYRAYYIEWLAAHAAEYGDDSAAVEAATAAAIAAFGGVDVR